MIGVLVTALVFGVLGAYPTVSAVCLVVLVIVVALAIVTEARYLRALDRQRSGRCWRCGYWLAGNRSGVCPECGLRVGPVRGEHAVNVE